MKNNVYYPTCRRNGLEKSTRKIATKNENDMIQDIKG